MARVMLINPPWYRLQGADFPEMPLGLCYIASFLKSAGHEVNIYNADFGSGHKKKYGSLYESFSCYKRTLSDLEDDIWKEIIKKVADYSPDVVGISLKTGSYRSGCNIAGLIRKNFPNIIITCGGVHPTLLPKEVMESGYFDYVVKGEGEKTFEELLDAIENKKPIKDVEGIVFFEDGHLMETPDRGFIEDLDALPFPEREDITDRDSYSSDALSIIMTARGCPFNCTFCASERIWHRKVRLRSSANVIDEILLLKEKYGVKHFKIRDDLFTINKKRALEICDSIIKKNLNITFQCEVRADSLDEDIVKAMRDAGCVGASIGVESGNDIILENINKGETTKQIAGAIKLLKKYGINVGAFIMMGFPGETEAQMLQTLDFIKRTRPDHVIVSILTPYPGTKIYEEACTECLIKTDLPWEDYFHQSPQMGFFPDKDKFDQIAKKIMGEIDRYNDSFSRRLKSKLLKVFSNPKAASRSIISAFKRLSNKI